MKSKIEELASIISLVKGELKSKKNSLIEADAFTSHTQGSINNIEKRIFALELDAVEIEERYSNQPDVFINFKKRASEIIKEIQELK